MTVKIVTDSTCDLPLQMAQELGITIVPCNVHFGETTYRDGLDMGHEEFYQKLVSSPIHPTTTQPSAGAFLEAYSALAEQTDEILSIHLTSKLSGTYNSALLGRQSMEKPCRIEIVDSLQTSMALGLLVLLAVEEVQKGATLDQVLETVKRAIPRVKLFALLDTLEYLEKGGRIGKLQAFLGSLLNVKPILTIEDGEVHSAGRVRTRARGLDRIHELTTAFNIIKMGIIYSTGLEEAERFAERFVPFFPREKTLIARVGPALGVHAGPGAIGVALMAGD